MGFDFNGQPKEPINLEQYAAGIVQRLPLRSVHQLHLPGIVMHHTLRSSRFISPDDYHEKIWGAGRWLASYILKHPEKFEGRRLLDIGTGSGIVAIAAALAGAEVTAIDCNSKAVCLSEINAKANGVSIKAIEQHITPETTLPDFDILTATDAMYSDFLSGACIQAFKNEATSATRHSFYICDQSGWTEGVFRRFKRSVKATGARLQIIKGGKKFGGPGSPINNNPVTTVKIEAPLI